MTRPSRRRLSPAIVRGFLFLGLALALLPSQQAAAQVTGYLGGRQAVQNPSCNAGAGGIVGQTYNGATCGLPTTVSPPVGLTLVKSAAPEASHVLKASAGNLYGYSVTAGGSAGYVMVFDAATVPPDGAVTPTHCEPIAANSTLAGSAMGDPPEAYANGIVVVFSSTGCFTKTGQAAAFIRGRVQ